MKALLKAIDAIQERAEVEMLYGQLLVASKKPLSKLKAEARRMSKDMPITYRQAVAMLAARAMAGVSG